MTTAAERFAGLSTPAKLLLILTAALLPIGLGLVWIASQATGDANALLRRQAEEQAGLAAREIESLIARNALAMRIAVSGALAEGRANACDRARRSLAIAPAIRQDFALQTPEGELICSFGGFDLPSGLPFVAPGDIRLRVARDERSLIVRVGVMNGIATASLPLDEIRAAALLRGGELASLIIRDDERILPVINPQEGPDSNVIRSINEWGIANGQLVVRTGTPVPLITTSDRLMLLLPFLMWLVAAIITWLLVTRLLIQPLRRLQRAVSLYEPGDPAIELPRKLGPAMEIQAFRDAFARAVTRVAESEREMADALQGQRRLVREVHHRVKNNLQVIASLLNIHGRSAGSQAGREAYSAIGRRVGALAIVHRNHYAEMEENRGISMRPLLAELAAELRSGAPESARGLAIELEVEPLSTTQDVAVSVAFLITEVVEFAMLNRPDQPVEISLRRTSDLTGRLTIGSPVLDPESEEDREKVQFERIIAGLAKQLRSSLDRKLGRYSVDLPVFPPR